MRLKITQNHRKAFDSYMNLPQALTIATSYICGNPRLRFVILEVYWQLKCWLVSFNIVSYYIYTVFIQFSAQGRLPKSEVLRGR